MWYLKTKLGIFWVAPIAVEKEEKYYLGVNDQELGIYTDAEQAARDVHEQRTGFYKWDSEARISAPEHISEWKEGEPTGW